MMARFSNLSCLAALLIPAACWSAGADDLLATLRWNARILLMFSPSPADTRAVAFSEAVDSARCEIEDRDLQVGKIYVDEAGLFQGVPVSATLSAELRDRFRVAGSDFLVFLIGKDGSVKATYDDAPSLSKVFDLIDGMPMRRREVLTRKTACRAGA